MTASDLLNQLVSRLPSGLAAPRLRAPTPSLGVALSAEGLSVARVRRERRALRLAGHALETLPPGAFSTGLLRFQIERPDLVVPAVKKAVEQAGGKAGRASLSLPDIAGRVVVLTLPEIPRSDRQAEDLIRFRTKRSLPFRPEEVAVSFTRLSPLAVPSGNGRGAHPILAVLALRPVIEQHERALAEAGLRVGLVSLATLDLANLFREDLARMSAEGNDAAFLNCEPAYSTLVIVRGGEPIFFRSKMHHESDREDEASQLRNLRRELTTSLSYYTEKLAGQTPLPVLFRCADPLAEGLAEGLEDLGFRLSAPGSPGGAVRAEGTSEGTLTRLGPALGITAGRMR